MGLDTSHDCWHGAYSAFSRWRQELAKAAGLPPLDFMEGFWSSPKSGTDLWGAALTIKVAADSMARAEEQRIGRPADDMSMSTSLLRIFDFPAIRWDALKPDVLHALLCHSDCDGSIPAAECAPLADRLAELLPEMSNGTGGGHIERDGGWRAVTQRFIDGLRKAVAAGEDVEFH